MQKISHYRDLNVWKKGIEIVKTIYTSTKKFPSEERYGLITQMQRSAVSIPSNIAEGFRRGHNKELKRFLHIALGSCAELETQVIISGELGYIEKTCNNAFLEQLDVLSRMLVSFIKKIN